MYTYRSVWQTDPKIELLENFKLSPVHMFLKFVCFVLYLMKSIPQLCIHALQKPWGEHSCKVLLYRQLCTPKYTIISFYLIFPLFFCSLNTNRQKHTCMHAHMQVQCENTHAQHGRVKLGSTSVTVNDLLSPGTSGNDCPFINLPMHKSRPPLITAIVYLCAGTPIELLMAALPRPV